MRKTRVQILPHYQTIQKKKTFLIKCLCYVFNLCFNKYYGYIHLLRIIFYFGFYLIFGIVCFSRKWFILIDINHRKNEIIILVLYVLIRGCALHPSTWRTRLVFCGLLCLVLNFLKLGLGRVDKIFNPSNLIQLILLILYKFFSILRISFDKIGIWGLIVKIIIWM